MGSRPISDRVKKHKCSATNDKRLHEAAAKYIELRDNGQKVSYRDIEKMFPGVSKDRVNRVVEKKGATIREFNATKQKLSPVEEGQLVDLMLESSKRGFPMPHREIRRYANLVLQSRLGADCEPLSDKWVFKFLDRHHNRLQTFWSKSLDMQRAYSLNPEAVKSWFDIVEEFIVKTGIDRANLYGMDESGFPTAYPGKDRVVGERGTKTQHKQGGADRENVTVVVTICADGTTVRPLVIFKGKNLQSTWNQDNTANA